MVKVLLTGMSGVGKSTILDYLKLDGHQTIDLDYDEWINYDDVMNDYVLDTKRMITYMEQNNHRNVFLAVTTSNQKEIYSYLDYVIVLTAPVKIMKDRIQTRDNSFGKSEAEWNKIKSDKELFEPLIIQSSDFTISTDKAISEVLSELYHLIGF